MVRIVWTDEAVSWINEIHEYISRDNVAAASRVIRGIYERVEQLLQFPELGQRLTLSTKRDVRVLLYGHYRIAYRIRSETIEILGVYHGALDIARRLNERTEPTD